jgi:hypothetical protein
MYPAFAGLGELEPWAGFLPNNLALVVRAVLTVFS